MQRARSGGRALPERGELVEMPRRDVLWLRDFLFYRIPVAASYLLRETSLICAKQKPPLTTAQWRIISILANHPSLLATEISRISMLDEVAVSRALALLARRGLVQKKKNRQDKRAREVSLTPAGWRYYGAIMPRMREQNEIVRGLFNQAQLHALYQALDRIDDLFKELGAQRRLYGRNLNLKDLVDRKLRLIASGSENRRPAKKVTRRMQGER
jgi:DNA-binding MarR family transcriptional regulator